MKLRKTYFKQILLTGLLIICSQHDIYSQGTDISRGKKPGTFIGLSLGSSQSQIINEGTLSVSKLLSNKKNSFFGSLEIGYFFSRGFGLSSGVGLNSYSTQLTLDTYQNKFNAKDSEDESYERRISGSDIKEEQQVNYLCIPFIINLRIPFGKTVGFFIQPGVNLAIPLSNNYTSSGTFTYKGYYPAYNILVEDLSDFHFPSNVSNESDGELELKSTGFNAIVSAGLDFIIKKKLQIGVGVCYSKSLSNISEYASPEDFQLSADADQINSLMGGSSKATAQSMGLKIIFRYYLK